MEKSLAQQYAGNIPQLDVNAMITLVLLFHVLEIKVESGVVAQFSWHG